MSVLTSALIRSRSGLLSLLSSLPDPALRRLAGTAIVIDGKTLDPAMQLLLRIQRLEGPPIEALPLSKGRRALEENALTVGGRQRIGSVSDRTIDGPGGPLSLRFYAPRGMTGLAPTLLYLHGGGWMYGSLEGYDPLCRFLAEEAQMRVVAVDYRLAPEHPFPAAVTDVRSAWNWLVAHAEAVGADPDRLAVGGDSAGGNLAAALCQELLAEGARLPAFQFLIYPATLFGVSRPSRTTFGQGFFLTTEFMDLALEHYLVGGEDLADPRLSPLHGVKPGLPPAYVLTAGFDPLLDEGREYAEALRAAGVPVEYVCAEGLIHGFANMLVVGRTAPRTMRRAAVALQRGVSAS